MATDFPASPSNGDTHAGFTYNSTTGTWETSLSTSSIDLLADVDTATAAPSTGNFLKWNGTNWVPTPSVGITHVDTWNLSSDVTTSSQTVNPITTWTHTPTSADFEAVLGSPMTVSSGYWTFPTTGYWKVEFIARIDINSNDNINIGITGALYSGGTLSSTTTLAGQPTGDIYTVTLHTGYVFKHVNVTNTSNIKVGLYTSSLAAGNAIIASSSSTAYTYATFTRLADAV